MHIKDFRALYALEQHAKEVASVPYDTLSRSEAAVIGRRNRLNFLHVTRAEIDLPELCNPYSEEVYIKAAENWRFLQQHGILVREQKPCLYLYEVRKNSHICDGVIACVNINDYRANIIKKHEKTRLEKEQDRARHISYLHAHTGPVLIMYRDEAIIDKLIYDTKTQHSLYDLNISDTEKHTIWRIENTQPFLRAFEKISACYIADGHHRAVSAVQVANEQQAKNRGDSISDECNWFLSALFPTSQLRILPYNRAVRDLSGKSIEQFLKAVSAVFSVTAGAQPVPPEKGHISMYLDQKWYDISLLIPMSSSNPADFLDVSVLQTHLLEPILGITDPQKDIRIQFISGIRGTEELINRVNSGQARVAFSLFPVSIEQIITIADAGETMPPKSTWFEPKLMSGLLIHTF